MPRAAATLLALLPLLLAPSLAGAGAGLPQAVERVLASLDGPSLPAFRSEAARVGARVVEEFPFIDAALVEAPAAAVPALAALPGVAGVYGEEPLALLLSSSRPAVGAGPALWDLGVAGSRVAVAVVDSGIDGEHPALAGRVLRAVRVGPEGAAAGEGDADGHGTHVAGIVAGNGAGSPRRALAGIAPAAGLVAVDISSSFTTTNAVRAFGWLHEHGPELGVRVVSNSWGREREDARYDPDDPVVRASDALVRAGLVVVFSAGNLGPGPGTLTVEAQNPNVLTVGASDDAGRVEAYSSRGPARLRDGGPAPWPKPDLLAPGTSITSTRAGAGRGGEAYATLSGTSMAAPHVAGIAALLLDAHPALGPEEVKELLLRAARDTGPPGHDIDAGAGLVDARAAVEHALRLAAQPAEPEREPFRGAGEVTYAAGLLAQGSPLGPGEARIGLAVPRGAVGLEFALRWDEPRTRFGVWLENGGRTLGPFRGAAASGSKPGWLEMRALVEEPLDAGPWSLVAKPEGSGLAARYEVEGAVLVQTSHLPPLPPAARGALGAFPALLGPAEAAGLPLWAWGAAALGLAALGAAAWRRREAGAALGRAP